MSRDELVQLLHLAAMTVDPSPDDEDIDIAADAMLDGTLAELRMGDLRITARGAQRMTATGRWVDALAAD